MTDLHAAIGRQLTDLTQTLDDVRRMAASPDVPTATLARTLTELEDATEWLTGTVERLDPFTSEETP